MKFVVGANFLLLLLYAFFSYCITHIPVYCYYLEQSYEIGQVVFLDTINQPFYCTSIAGKGQWRNIKRAQDPDVDLEMDSDGLIYLVESH